jgi:Mu-like prophage protein Com
MSMPDRRVPGTSQPQLIEYRCPLHDGESSFDEIAPKCPRCGTLMIPVEDPYAERRRKLREAREA